MPLFSIITVTFNAAATLPPTFASVAAQTFRDYEHIIIDGASTDGTQAMATAAGATLLSEPDDGLYDAMNKGLDIASGDYIIYLNAGDAFHAPDTLQRVADAIAANGTPGMVYGQTVIVDADRHVLGPRHLTAPEQLDYTDFARGMMVCHQAMAVRRAIAPHYNMAYRYSADYEWAIRVLQLSRLNVYIGGIMIDYLNEGETTRHHRRSLLERFRIMCRYYGTLPTLMRHIGFALRAMRRQSLDPGV